jgi:type II secretory pathway component PulL
MLSIQRGCGAVIAQEGADQCPLSRSLLGVKRTWLVAAHMSACDPKRTWLLHREMSAGPKIGADALEFSLAQLNSGRFHALRFR